MPDRVHCRGTDAVFCEEVIEFCEMAFFLVVHVFHQGAEMGMGFDNWRSLRGVDEGSG